MKKIIGVLGVTVIAATMFFSNNNAMSGSDISLASLVGMNSANAECQLLRPECPVWYITVRIEQSTEVVVCENGGASKCML
jgi:hypothetical protein